MNIKDLSPQQKQEIAEYYSKQFSSFLEHMQHTFTDINDKQDPLALAFIVDIFKGFVLKIADEILDDDDIDMKDYVLGWKKDK